MPGSSTLQYKGKDIDARSNLHGSKGAMLSEQSLSRQLTYRTIPFI